MQKSLESVNILQNNLDIAEKNVFSNVHNAQYTYPVQSTMHNTVQHTVHSAVNNAQYIYPVQRNHFCDVGG